MIDGKAIKGQTYWMWCGFRKETYKVFAVRGGEWPRVCKIYSEERLAAVPEDRRYHKYGCDGLGIVNTVSHYSLYETEDDILNRQTIIKLC